MIVVDASAMVDALVGREADAELLEGLAGELDAPHLLDVEVMSVLRGLQLGGKLDSTAAEQARRDHFAFTITRHEVNPLAERIWRRSAARGLRPEGSPSQPVRSGQPEGWRRYSGKSDHLEPRVLPLSRLK